MKTKKKKQNIKAIKTPTQLLNLKPKSDRPIKTSSFNGSLLGGRLEPLTCRVMLTCALRVHVKDSINGKYLL